VASPDGPKGAVGDDPYGIQWQVWRRSVRDTVAGVAASRPCVPDSTGVVVTVPGVVLQARGRPHRTNSGGDGVPPA
jgi:hypothetical protein